MKKLLNHLVKAGCLLLCSILLQPFEAKCSDGPDPSGYQISLPADWRMIDSADNVIYCADSSNLLNLRIKVMQRTDSVSAFAILLSIDSLYRESGYFSDLTNEALSSINDSAFLAQKNADQLYGTAYYNEKDPDMINSVLVFRKRNSYFVFIYRYPFEQTERADDNFYRLMRSFYINEM